MTQQWRKCLKIGVLCLGLSQAGVLLAWDHYGPVPSGFTVAKVAKQLHLHGASQADVMKALKILNPSTLKGSYHEAIKPGVSLRVPGSAKEVFSLLGVPAVHPASDHAVLSGARYTAPVSGNVSEPMPPVATAPLVQAGPDTSELSALKAKLQASEHRVSELEQAADDDGFPWSWLWFLAMAVLGFVVYHQRRLIRDLRLTHHIVTSRVGAHKSLRHQELGRYKTLEGFGESKVSPVSSEHPVMKEVLKDLQDKNYAAAEKKLLNAIRQEKTNLDLRIKLLEVYVAMNDPTEFNRQVEYLLKHLINEQDEAWLKIRELYLRTWVYER